MPSEQQMQYSQAGQQMPKPFAQGLFFKKKQANRKET
jgi:hypothetical protein